ncbi:MULTISPECIES: hypothetical protein [unclassified Streptomyces]|uniref:hypothetical protein n=1 Tax=unclassified Streptomyces TaxID=2593676 RepID=UPI0036EFAAE3
MTDLHTTPSAAAAVDPAADAVLAARAAAAGEHLAGLIAAAQLDTVGTPRKLATDLFPDDDPETVARVWARALAVGVRAGQLMGTPRFYRDKLATLRGQLEDAGYAAMGRTMGPVLSAAERAPEWHLVDGEFGREHE